MEQGNARIRRTAPCSLAVALLRGSVVPAAGSHAKCLLIVSDNFDGAVMAIMLKIGRFVGNGVLAAEFLLNGSEGVGHFADLEGEERAPTGGVGNALENL